MKPTVSLVTKVEVATEVAAVARVAAADGACRPMGILWRLRLQVSPHRCGSNEETGLMDRW